jgi:hypothetical protein
VNLFGRNGPDEEVVRRLKEWTRETLGLGSEDRVLVHEIRCPDPHCPPHGTVVGWIHSDGRQGKVELARPAAVIRRRDLDAALKDFIEPRN